MKKKNSLVQKRKHKKIDYLLKNNRIKSIYLNFKNNLSPHIYSDKFCIGVSGGADSLALSYLSKLYCEEFNKKCVVLIVNHRLREESGLEAKKVKFILSKAKISSKILIWKGSIPKSNIQAKAREIRYNLLFKQCKKLKIDSLLIGHHSNDFLENFFIRLFRGSGLKGLSSFDIFSFFKKENIKIIRPMINLKKEDLIYVTKKIFKEFIIDPSNFKSKYLRTGMRNSIEVLKKNGINFDKIKLTINNLQLADQTIDFYYNRSKTNYVRVINNNKFLINKKLIFNEGQEVIFRIMGETISTVGKKYYAPRGKNLSNLIKKMKLKDFYKSTLGGCLIEKANSSFLIEKE